MRRQILPPRKARQSRRVPVNVLRRVPADAEGENAIKIILLGDSAVGKSKLIERFLVRSEGWRELPAFAPVHRTSPPFCPLARHR